MRSGNTWGIFATKVPLPRTLKSNGCDEKGYDLLLLFILYR